MARRRRRRSHRSRRYGGLVSLPSLGGIKEYNPLGKTVKSTDVLVGVAIGLLGGFGVTWGLNKLDGMLRKPDGSGGLPSFVLAYMGPISSLGAGILAYALQRKRNRTRGTGHLVGAVAAGVVPTALRTAFPNMADYVSMDLGGYGGLLVDNPSVAGYGYLVDNPTSLGSLEAHAVASMAEDE